MLDTNNLKAILFDWDDTITGSFEAYSGWYKDFADFYNLPIPTRDSIRSSWGKTVSGIVASIWPELPDTELKVSEFKPSREYLPRPFDGVESTLQSMLDKGFVLGIVTSGWRPQVEHICNSFFSKRYHHFIFSQHESTYHKPDPRVFDGPLELLLKDNIKDSEVVYIGDHLNDYYAARDRGLQFLAVTTGITTKDDFIQAGLSEDMIYPAFTDLLSLLDR